mmetsp:Transcript_897/g.1394  ORF Transcript_897/g.1394 Transcript_897/m.1394 type:complete len:96 (+) Transcript_897:174-461(+)
MKKQGKRQKIKCCLWYKREKEANEEYTHIYWVRSQEKNSVQAAARETIEKDQNNVFDTSHRSMPSRIRAFLCITSNNKKNTRPKPLQNCSTSWIK